MCFLIRLFSTNLLSHFVCTSLDAHDDTSHVNHFHGKPFEKSVRHTDQNLIIKYCHTVNKRWRVLLKREITVIRNASCARVALYSTKISKLLPNNIDIGWLQFGECLNVILSVNAVYYVVISGTSQLLSTSKSSDWSTATSMYSIRVSFSIDGAV